MLQPFPSVDQTKAPFALPTGATSHGSPVTSPADIQLFCPMATAEAVLAQYDQALKKQKLQTLPGTALAIVDTINGPSPTNSQYTASPDGQSIFAIVGTVSGPGGPLEIQDTCGPIAYRSVNPNLAAGDTNYKEVIPELPTGVPDPADTKDVAVPGYVAFLVISDSSSHIIEAHLAAMPQEPGNTKGSTNPSAVGQRATK